MVSLKESKILHSFSCEKNLILPWFSWKRNLKFPYLLMQKNTLNFLQIRGKGNVKSSWLFLRKELWVLMIFLEKGKLEFPVTCLWKKRLGHPMGKKIPVGLSGMYSITRTRSFYLSALCAYYYDLRTKTFFLPVFMFVISFNPQFMLHVISWKRRPTLWRCCHPTFQSHLTQ